MPETPGVVVSYLYRYDVSGRFCHSMFNLMHYDAHHERFIKQKPRGGGISLATSPRIAEARNKLIDTFALDFPEAEWLLMLDDDMTFEGDLLSILMAEADPEKAPIIGGLCFTGGRGARPQPTIYKQVVVNEGQDDAYVNIDRVMEYPKNAMLRVGATGGACLLMHRSVFAKMKQAFGKDAHGNENIYPWFCDGITGPKGEPWGEDIMFCMRANALGIPVWVHTGARLGHVKQIVIDEEMFEDANEAAAKVQKAYAPSEAPINRAQRRAAARKKVRA